jgi:flagellar hook-length control protein FliK
VTTGGARLAPNVNANPAPQSNMTGNGKTGSTPATGASSKQPGKVTPIPDPTVGSTPPPPAPTTNAATSPPNNNPPTDDTADQSGSAPATAATTAAVATVAAKALSPAETSADPTTDTKAANKGADKNGKADVSGATPSTSQSPSPANVQPVATAIVVNSAGGSTPATPTPATVDALPAVAGQTKPRAKATPPAGGDPDVQGQDAADDAADSSAAPPSSADDQTSGATPSESTGTPAAATPPAAGEQQAQVQADTNAVLTQTEAAVQAGGGGGRIGPRADIVGATNAQGTAGAATAAAAGGATALPSFGFVAANALSAGAATSASASDTTVPLAGLAVAIASRAQAGSTQFDIRLDPPELGRIDVRLDVGSNGQVTTHVTADRADTLQLLQNQQPQLQQALEQAGLKTADNGLQFSLRDQSFAGQNGTGNGAGQQNTTHLVIPDADLAPVDTTQIYSRWSRGGGLDIRV